MPARRTRDPLFSTIWVHVFEEDERGARVYRPDDADIPLSRRPREQLRLDANGTARLFVPAPDDRLREEHGTWSEEDEAIVIEGPGGRTYRVVERSPERLVVRVS